MAPDEELPRVTLGLLRRADTMCPRRLAHEHESGRKPSRLSDAGFEVTNRIVADATLWHRGSVETDSEAIAFPDPTDLPPEQRAYYHALARGYLALFERTDAGVGELPATTELVDVGVRLVGPVGIPLEHGDGTRELRVIRVGRRGALVDSAEMRFTLLRACEWAPKVLRLVACDPLELRSVEYDLDVGEHLDEARSWLAERVDVIRARAHPRRTIAGSDCRFCSCVPGCPQITGT